MKQKFSKNLKYEEVKKWQLEHGAEKTAKQIEKIAVTSNIDFSI